MKSLRRVGTTQTKFVFSVHVADVRGLPASVTTVAVSWQRGDKAVATPSVTAQGSGNERGARIDAKLTHVATLYAHKDTYQSKPSILRVMHVPTAGAKPVVVATAELDLAEYVPTHAKGEAPPKPQVRQMVMTPPRGSEHKGLQVLVQLSVASQTLTAADASRAASGLDGGTSEAGDSEASQESAALTHEALSAYDERGQDGRGGGAPAAGWHAAASKATAGKAGGKRPDVAQVAQMMADAQEDARSAEARVNTLQHRLRVEAPRARWRGTAPWAFGAAASCTAPRRAPSRTAAPCRARRSAPPRAEHGGLARSRAAAIGRLTRRRASPSASGAAEHRGRARECEQRQAPDRARARLPAPASVRARPGCRSRPISTWTTHPRSPRTSHRVLASSRPRARSTASHTTTAARWVAVAASRPSRQRCSCQLKVPSVRVEDPPRQPNWWLPRLSSPLLAPECTVCSFEAGAVLRISPWAAPEHEAFFCRFAPPGALAAQGAVPRQDRAGRGHRREGRALTRGAPPQQAARRAGGAQQTARLVALTPG
jgi:hypothetical protein